VLYIVHMNVKVRASKNLISVRCAII
jgi:hypothetical protein